MVRRTMAVCLAAIGGLSGGCSWQSAAMSGGQMGWNLSKKDSHLKVWIDGHEGKQNALKKAVTGYSNWKIEERTTCTPKLRFQIEDPDKFGRITRVILSIHQEFEADYSHQAEYTIVATGSDPMTQMKPGTDYDLAALPAGFEIRNLTGQTVGRVDLKPGLKYKLTLSVVADKSETAQVEFKTT